jgi:mannosylglucosylglycerate synthase
MHFRDPVAEALGRRCFAGEAAPIPRSPPTSAPAPTIAQRLRTVVDAERPDLLVVQNAWAIPMQLPLALALADLVAERAVPTLSHEHDYWWERERFAHPKLPELLERAFPFHAPHVVAPVHPHGRVADELRARRGIDARWLPNVMDFDRPSASSTPSTPTSARRSTSPATGGSSCSRRGWCRARASSSRSTCCTGWATGATRS